MRRFSAGLVALLLVAGVVLAAEPAPAPDKAAVVKGNNEFAFDLYAQLRTRDGNLFFSPYSISTALAMTYAGARGDTAAQMADVLNFTLDQQRLHPAFSALLADTRPPQGDPKKTPYELHVANALWGQKGYTFQQDFLTLTRNNYGAGLRDVDFKAATEEARKTINAWVEEQTKDKIKELLKPGVLNPDTRLVLTNAIYFKGNWAEQFKKEHTREAPFTTAGGKKVSVPMMHKTDDYRHFDGGTFQALELPYVGKDLSMVVFLPKKVDGLAEFEKQLTAENLTAWLGKLRQDEVQVALPKFKITAEFSLKETLSAMGMKDAFDPRKADFSGISGTKDLFIQAVVHKAFVEVNEEGTEAAASTAVVVGTTSARITPVFRADHPFVFLIRDNRSGNILFLGRVADPSQ
jgi:serpin B